MPVIIKDNSKLLAEIPLSLEPESGTLKIYAGTPPDVPAEYSNLSQEKLKIMAEFFKENSE